MPDVINPIAEFIAEHHANIRYLVDGGFLIVKAPCHECGGQYRWLADPWSILLSDMARITEERLAMPINIRRLRHAIRYDYKLRIWGRMAVRHASDVQSYTCYKEVALPPPTEGQMLLAAACNDPDNDTVKRGYVDWVKENPDDVISRFHIARMRAAALSRKHRGYQTFLRLGGIDWLGGISKPLSPTDENICAYAASQAWLAGCKPSAKRVFLTADLCRCVERAVGFPIPPGVFIAAAEVDGFRSLLVQFAPSVLHGISPASHGLARDPDVKQYRDRHEIEELRIDRNWLTRPEYPKLEKPQTALSDWFDDSD